MVRRDASVVFASPLGVLSIGLSSGTWGQRRGQTEWCWFWNRYSSVVNWKEVGHVDWAGLLVVVVRRFEVVASRAEAFCPGIWGMGDDGEVTSARVGMKVQRDILSTGNSLGKELRSAAGKGNRTTVAVTWFRWGARYQAFWGLRRGLEKYPERSGVCLAFRRAGSHNPTSPCHSPPPFAAFPSSFKQKRGEGRANTYCRSLINPSAPGPVAPETDSRKRRRSPAAVPLAFADREE